ncbi:MAG: hypothetical protein KDA80_24615 [Planctomycetaceae bacterium]|nr:hypothetical protein [Planctomycetaceae bacterium]
MPQLAPIRWIAFAITFGGVTLSWFLSQNLPVAELGGDFPPSVTSQTAERNRKTQGRHHQMLPLAKELERQSLQRISPNESTETIHPVVFEVSPNVSPPSAVWLTGSIEPEPILGESSPSRGNPDLSR